MYIHTDGQTERRNYGGNHGNIIFAQSVLIKSGKDFGSPCNDEPTMMERTKQRTDRMVKSKESKNGAKEKKEFAMQSLRNIDLT